MTQATIEAQRRLEEHLASLLSSRLRNGAGQVASRDVAETQAALERIANGTYGRCESCTGAIGRQRLLALPATRFCIACAAIAASAAR